MYKLIFAILTLSGFLFYKALTLKAARKTNFKNTSVSAQKKFVGSTSFSVKKLNSPQPNAKNPLKAVPLQVNQPPTAHPQEPKSQEQLQREEFDSLGAVYHQSEEVDESRVTPEEKEAFNTTIELMQRIEAEAEATKTGPKGSDKRPEDLTLEEQRQFEIYNQFEKKESQ